MGNLYRYSMGKRTRKRKNIHIQSHLNNQESGFTALLVLILLMSLSLYGMEAFIKAHSEHRIVKREAERFQAVTLAEGGFEWAKGELTINPSWSGGDRLLSGGHLVVNVNPSEDGKGYWVISSAQVGFARRKIKALLIVKNNFWTVSKYEVLNK